MPDALACMANAGHPVDGVIHIGIREDHPAPDYRYSGASPCIYICSSATACERITKNLAGDLWHIPISATISKDTNHFLLTSMPDQTVKYHPILTDLIDSPNFTLDELVERFSPHRSPNLMVISDEAAELKILAGAKSILSQIDGVFVSIAENSATADPSAFTELQKFFSNYDLYLRWLDFNQYACGQAFFSRPVSKNQPLPSYTGNVALGKIAVQSSVYNESGPATPEHAAGAVNGQITGGAGFHTDLEDSPWWVVDLGKIHALQEIRVYNRSGPERARARTLKILTSDDGVTWWEIHNQSGYSFGGLEGRPLRVALTTCRARYVVLCLSERTYLHLDEIEIYGTAAIPSATFTAKFIVK